MARIKLSIPKRPADFITQLDVRIGDINYGGHLSNDSVLRLCHEARIRFFKSFGQSELNIYDKSIIMSDSAIIYKAEAFQGDILRFELFIDDINNYGFDIIYIMKRESDSKEIARAKTGIVFFDYSSKKVSQTPEKFVKLYNSKMTS